MKLVVSVINQLRDENVFCVDSVLCRFRIRSIFCWFLIEPNLLYSSFAIANSMTL